MRFSWGRATPGKSIQRDSITWNMTPEYGHFPGQKEIVGIFIFCSHCGHMNLMDVETSGIKILAPKSE